MSKRADELVAKFEQLNSELIGFVSGLTDEQLKARTGDDGGATVGDVLAHLGEGAPEVLAWLTTATDTPAPRHEHHHGHSHSHGHTHHHGNGRQDIVQRLNDSLETVVGVLRTLSDEQLGCKPPAAPGITDGSKELGAVIDLMIGHQANHLAHIRQAVELQQADTAGEASL
ncbi:DinB family protein [Streptomyces soliscabiei]|uniref:DinB family protein n=1 Tax=Streptomyces soliscabiei TaxID=588897 RepID=UPI0029BB4C59|nr:DinB family protein [Streptomyces sp. NY05-11A]MDX2679233.1 DinB family protein [Streptomyces sp. NY05-11A]